MIRAALFVTLGALAACGDSHEDHHGDHADAGGCLSDPRADTFVAGLEKTTASGLKLRLQDSQPSPPAKGDNQWTIRIVDGADVPLDGLTLTVRPYMPDHGHGTSIVAVVSSTGTAGEYDVSPVNLWMPGLWQVTIGVDNGGTEEDVVFSFCISG